MKIAVYTCITRDYDKLRLPSRPFRDIDFYCFTDNPSRVKPPFIFREIKCAHLTSIEQNRFLKMHPHLFLPEYDVSVYVDGNIQVVGDVSTLARRALKEAKVAAYSHPERDCIYEEAKACALLGLEWVPTIVRQVRAYGAEGYPAHRGLAEANILVRRHNDEEVIAAMEFWWSQFLQYARRDQLSLNYVCWQKRLDICNLGKSDARFSHEYFEYKPRSPRTAVLRTFRKVCNRVAGPVLYPDFWRGRRPPAPKEKNE